MTRLGPVDPNQGSPAFGENLSDVTSDALFARYVTVSTPESLQGRITHGPDSNLSSIFTRKVGGSEGA